MQYECGDVLKLMSMRGEQHEIRVGIVMGLLGSKYGRKVIPIGWYNVKIKSFTFEASAEQCHVPTGWVDPLKYKFVANAHEKIIPWPNELLRQ
jgi:hypothetical protein